ncbi:MAG: glycosyltransferase [Acidobacteriota bacterium]
MKMVFFCHPAFMRSQSMPRFARMVGEAMRARGHDVAYWAPEGRCHAHFKGTRLEKWAGYVDQYVLFPLEIRRRLRETDPNTLFVFCDQALGPWVPLVKHRPHVVHAHDLLALRSALGLIPQNPTSWSGRLYQRYIRHGFRQAQHFIAVSKRTQAELTQYGQTRPGSSIVVYNGLNHPYRAMAVPSALQTLHHAGVPVTERGMVLHVGGDQWYKNTAGVVRLYAEYVKTCDQSGTDPLPLLMVSPLPKRPDVLTALEAVPATGQVRFCQGIDNTTLEAAYSLAKAFLFPSLAEGFGWPIIESQICGCPVITTDDAPMNEIGGPGAYYLPLLTPADDPVEWAAQGARVLLKALQDDLSADARAAREKRIAWAQNFTAERALQGYEAVYRDVCSNSSTFSTIMYS